jgi:hypothetical protein
MRKSLLFFILLINLHVSAQDWIKSFTDGDFARPFWLIETYDKGYIILDNENVYSWVIKTDINGNKLWDKRIGTGQDHIFLWNIEQTIDGGSILSGGFAKYGGQNDDPSIIKLNACGELDWCSVIKTAGINDFGTRVKQTPEGDYILVAQGSVLIPGENVQLFKFDYSGNLLWKHTYHPDTLIWSPEPHDVRVDDDGYLISAMCYYPDSVNPSVGYERPYYIKTDTAGNILWWLVYGSENGFHGFSWDATVKSSTGNYYSLSMHSNYCDTPGLVKCTGNGQESYYQDFIPGLCPGGSASVNWVDDSTLISTAYGTISGNTIHRWIKMDTLGILKSFIEFPSWIDGTTHTTRTFDNKFISVARANDYWIYLYKLNSNLEYDSVYIYPYVYDSLCPGGVVSDTINPDCGLVVNIEDPQNESLKAQLKIFPNPASGNLTVEFPECHRLMEKKSGITTTVSQYTWKSTTLEIYNIDGKKVVSLEIPKDQRQLELDVSGWKRGMYYFRMIHDQNTVAGQKVILD